MAESSARIGARIADVRESNRLTQQELAAASGIERSALAKIERGLRGLGALELAALAKALDVRLEWLLSDAPVAIASHRTRANADVVLRTIDREIERVARDVENLNTLHPSIIPKSMPPADVPSTAVEAERLATDARASCGLDVAAPVNDLVDRLADVGLLAFSMPLGEETADAATTLLEQGAVAIVNSTSMVGRRRIALAHEFGHYLVADEYTIDWRVAENGGSDRVESLLDRFARAFLAPESALRPYWQEASERYGDLRTAAVLAASHFRIDMSTLARRLGELGLAAHEECADIRKYRTTKSDIVEHGLTVPYDLEDVSLPRRYKLAVLDLYKKEKLSAERALSLLHRTFEIEDLPELRTKHPDEIWSVLP